MSNLTHWHKMDPDASSALTKPPSCCAHEFGKQLQRQLAEQERRHDEQQRADRKQILGTAVNAATEYGLAAASVLSEDQAQLVNTITANIVAAIKRTACICPSLDVSTFAGNTRTIRGRDAACGMHEPEEWE